MTKFWNWTRNEDTGERILRLEGPVDEDNFWGDEVVPAQFREELEAEDGDVTVWINSPGGNVFAAAQIYTMLCDHKGRITVKIDAIAASAASVIAMAGDRVLMSPVAMLMIHDPMTIAMGNAKDMEKAISTLHEVKASIINAYQRKTGLSRGKISQLMENETWMNARKAVELGFADEILFTENPSKDPDEGIASESTQAEGAKSDGKEVEARLQEWQPYSTKIMGQKVLNWLVPACEASTITGEASDETACVPTDVESTETGMTDMFEEAIGETMPISEEETSVESEPSAASESTGNSTVRGDSEDRDSGDDDPEESVTGKNADDASIPKDTLRARCPVNHLKSQWIPSSEESEQPGIPFIGKDGKTKDGAMPYDLLIRQLEFLK